MDVVLFYDMYNCQIRGPGCPSTASISASPCVTSVELSAPVSIVSDQLAMRIKVLTLRRRHRQIPLVLASSRRRGRPVWIGMFV